MGAGPSEPRAGKVITDESGVWKPQGAYYGRPFDEAQNSAEVEKLTDDRQLELDLKPKTSEEDKVDHPED